MDHKEGWAPKNWCQRTDAFELWCWRRLFLKIFNLILIFNFIILYWFCHISTWIRHRYTRVPHPEPSSLLPSDSQGWRRLLRVPWTARKSNQSILKEINTEYSLEILMLKLELQYFGHMMWKADSLEKTLMLGKIASRRRGWQRTRWLDGITDLMSMSLSKFQEMVRTDMRCAAVYGITQSRLWLSKWTTMLCNHHFWLVQIFYIILKVNPIPINSCFLFLLALNPGNH